MLLLVSGVKVSCFTCCSTIPLQLFYYCCSAVSKLSLCVDIMTALIESYVFQWLPEADVALLTAVCVELQINVPHEKEGLKPDLLKLVLRFLNSETLEDSADKGAGVFLKLFGDLGDHLGKGQRQPKPEPVLPANDVAGGAVAGGVAQTGYKREFKISGSIGELGQKDTLSFDSLDYQMRQARAENYSHGQIRSAVVKAIKPGLTLRNYLETHKNITEKAFIGILQSHFNEKDAAAVFQDLANCYQGQMKTGESAHDFCMRAMAIRDKVANMSETEGSPWNDQQLSTRFFHTVFTGLKQSSIRMELQTVLKAGTASDEDLLRDVSEAAANESERMGKVEKKKADISALTESAESNKSSSNKCAKTTEKQCKQTEHAHNELLATINQIATKMDQLTTDNAAVRSELQGLKTKMADSSNSCPPGLNVGATNFNASGGANFVGGGKAGPGRLNNVPSDSRYQQRRPFFRCKNCEQSNSSYCHHCFNCGAADHRSFQCDKPKNR